MKKIDINQFKTNRIKKFGDIEVINPRNKKNTPKYLEFLKELENCTEIVGEGKDLKVSNFDNDRIIFYMIKIFTNLDLENMTPEEVISVVNEADEDLSKAILWLSKTLEDTIIQFQNVNLNKLNELIDNSKLTPEARKEIKNKIGNTLNKDLTTEKDLKEERVKEINKEIIEKEKQKQNYDNTLEALKFTNNKKMIKDCQTEIDIIQDELSILYRQLDELDK